MGTTREENAPAEEAPPTPAAATPSAAEVKSKAAPKPMKPAAGVESMVAPKAKVAVAGVESMVAPKAKVAVAGVESMVAPSGPSEPTVGFEGNDRFEVVRRVGAGGMGEVYEVLDRDRDQHVALKTLRNFGPLEQFLFKNEFRSLSDIVHPNLVGLHELLADGSTWFFTMDYVPGVDLLAWVRGDAEPTQPAPSGAGSSGPIEDTMALDLGAGSPPSSSPAVPDTLALELSGGGVPSGVPKMADTVALDVGAGLGSGPAIEETFALEIGSGGPPSSSPVVEDTLAVGASSGISAAIGGISAASTGSMPSVSSGSPAVSEPWFPPLDADGLERLKDSLRQLCAAVHALHLLGKLHRDIKPSNILVAADGRVVLLDFGLIVDLALYRGDNDAALEHAENLWTGLFKTQLKMVAILKATAYDLMARALLAAGKDPKRVAKCARKLDVFGPGWGEAPASLLRAQLSGVDGWKTALSTCEAADMAMHAAAARWRLGEAIGGDEGAELVAAARAWFEGEGVVRPERLVAMLTPGGPAGALTKVG